jgi:hypothetical protein
MSKKIIQDIKTSNNSSSKISQTDIFTKDAPKSIEKNIYNDSSKYDFLTKKSKSSVSTKRILGTPNMPKKRAFNKIILYAFIISLIIGIFYLLSTVFFKAKVTITPKGQSFELKNETFTGGKLKTDQIPFEVMSLSDTEDKDVVFTSSKDMSEKAKGEITLYNEYSTKKQTLTAGSFISDEKGISYKIDNTISIPGYTQDKSKVITPGQISIGITSFLAGEAYNGSPVSFYITSFKGTTKYKKIYGKLKTPLSGGMSGLVYLLDEGAKQDILSNTASFKDKLLRKLFAQVPAGYILYPDGVNFSYEIVGDTSFSKNPNTQIEMKGTVGAFLIKETSLSDFLIKRLLPDITSQENREISLSDLSALTFNFVNKDQVVDKDVTSFDFALTGNLQMSWKPSLDLLKILLLGKKKTEVVSIFKQDPGIVSASVKIFPPWLNFLPSEVKNINILIK